MQDNPPMPPAMRRRGTIVAIVGCLPLLVIILLWQMGYLPSQFGIFLLFMAGVAFQVVAIVGGTLLLSRRLREHDYAVCLRCMYPLADASGICPECGGAYDRAEARAAWMRHGTFLGREPGK